MNYNFENITDKEINQILKAGDIVYTGRETVQIIHSYIDGFVREYRNIKRKVHIVQIIGDDMKDPEYGILVGNNNVLTSFNVRVYSSSRKFEYKEQTINQILKGGHLAYHPGISSCMVQRSRARRLMNVLSSNGYVFTSKLSKPVYKMY